MSGVWLAGLADLPAVARQARRAATEDYGFYPAEVQATIAGRNALKPLIAAWRDPNRLIIGAWQNNVLMGNLIGTLDTDGIASVHWIYVAPEGRGSGLAKQLLQAFEDEVRRRNVPKIMLWTEIAPDYYRKIGWVEEAFLPNHWWGQTFFIFAKYL